MYGLDEQSAGAVAPNPDRLEAVAKSMVVFGGCRSEGLWLELHWKL
jgi:hypothetical protein